MSDLKILFRFGCTGFACCALEDRASIFGILKFRVTIPFSNSQAHSFESQYPRMFYAVFRSKLAVERDVESLVKVAAAIEKKGWW